MTSREGWTSRLNVSEKDPDYTRKAKSWRDSYSSSIFGRGALFMYDINTQAYERGMQNISQLEVELSDADEDRKERIKRSIEEVKTYSEGLLAKRGEYLRSDFGDLFQNYLALIKRPDMEDRQNFIQHEIEEMFNIPGMSLELVKYLGLDRSKHTYSEILEKIKDGTIPDEFLERLARRHVERIEIQEKALETVVESTKSDFKAVVAEGVTEGWLPKEAQESLNRIMDVKVVLSDRLERMHSMILGESRDSGRISVSNERLNEKEIHLLKKTLFHEFLHEISGVSITIETKIEDERLPIHHVYKRKSGLVVSGVDSFYSKNRWLNEAVTEWLALKLAKKVGYSPYIHEDAYKGSVSYLTERKELERLFSVGLSEKLLVDAYFENFAEDNRTGNKGENFAALVKEINKLEGVYGMAVLQNKFELEESMISLYYQGVMPLKGAEDLVRYGWPKDYKVIKVIVTSGSSDRGLGSFSREFLYIQGPRDISGKTVSGEEQWKSIEDTILAPMKKSGLVNYTIEDIKTS